MVCSDVHLIRRLELLRQFGRILGKRNLGIRFVRFPGRRLFVRDHLPPHRSLLGCKRLRELHSPGPSAVIELGSDRVHVFVGADALSELSFGDPEPHVELRRLAPVASEGFREGYVGDCLTFPVAMSRYLRAGAGVKGVLFRDGRVLLLHRRDDLILVPGLWDLPGGGVEVGADLEETLVREVREETGFVVTVGRPILAWVHSTRTTRGRKVTSIIVCYECRTRARGRPRLDPEEHTEFAWVGGTELGDYPLPPNYLDAILRVFGRNGSS
jgi:8-oxo-dGTP diphosphatase